MIGMEPYEMIVGPEGYLPPSVSRGVIGPSKEEDVVMGPS